MKNLKILETKQFKQKFVFLLLKSGKITELNAQRIRFSLTHSDNKT